MDGLLLSDVRFRFDWKLEMHYRDDGDKVFTFFAMVNGIPTRTGLVSGDGSDASLILRAMRDILHFEQHHPNASDKLCEASA